MLLHVHAKIQQHDDQLMQQHQLVLSVLQILTGGKSSLQCTRRSRRQIVATSTSGRRAQAHTRGISSLSHFSDLIIEHLHFYHTRRSNREEASSLRR